MGHPPRIAILGAGPIGLEAALAAAERGWDFTVYEADVLPAGHVCRWGHVRAFTPWRLNVSARMAAALRRAGAEVPAGEELPTGAELVDRLYAPVAALPELQGRLALGSRVDAVGRTSLLKHEEIGTGARGEHPFRILVTGADGEEAVASPADVVIDCTGTYGNPNALGDGGIPAPGERAHADRIVQRLPDFAAEPEGGDCLAQESHGAETLVNPEPGFFLLGAKSYGRNSQFLLRIGWDQVDDVFGLLDTR